MTDELSLDGLVAVVTGAGAGLGRAEALAAHLRGDRGRGGAERKAFGEVQREEGREAAVLGGELVGQLHGRAALWLELWLFG